MRLTKRLFAALAAPALLAGLFVVGSAAASPTVIGTQWGKITFTANVTYGTSTYTISSTSCSLKLAGHPTASSCFLSGAGLLTNQGKIQTADLVVLDNKLANPLTINLNNLHGCGGGQAVLISKNGSPSALIAVTGTWPTTPVITETIKLFNPPHAVTCL